jgi:hypothetical protein
MRLVFALFHYLAAFVFIYAAMAHSSAEQLSTGFPETAADMEAALLLTVGMTSKLMGHIWLFSMGRSDAC